MVMRRTGTYWADDDPEYIRRQQELGRDTSELMPETRLKFEAELHARQAQAEATITDRLRTGLGRRDDDPFRGGFEARRFPWYRRLFLRLRGWE